MNRNNKESFIHRARATVASTQAKAYAAGGALVSAAPFAFAQTGDFDSADILAKIGQNVTIAVGIVAAMILGVWTLRSMGLLKGRG